MATKNSDALVLLSRQNGWTLIQTDSPLTRLNYFDGKFLRAADLKAEQDYLRNLVQKSNAADGPGVAHGFDLSLASDSDTLNVAPGLAFDPQGRMLLLTASVPVNIQQLIEQSRDVGTASKKIDKTAGGGEFGDCEESSATQKANPLLPSDLYLITIAQAEGYCGTEDVYGQLCKEACSTSTDRPYIIEGVVLRARLWPYPTLFATSSAVALTQAHRRSLVASAYFEYERNVIASLISGTGLKSDVWCFGAEGAQGGEVPLGVIARSGTSTLFLDAWTVRRERIDTPARRYWQWRMRMRPWDVYLAQILQFQCQLRDNFRPATAPGSPDPCEETHKLVAEAAEALDELSKLYESISSRLVEFGRNNSEEVIPYRGGTTELKTLSKKLRAAKEAHQLKPSNRLLINGGIVELPSAGYLPVAPGEALTVNEQVRLLMGEGVDLRFCVVRPDYVAHALEEAQHMERISLLEGLDDPKKKPEVDVLVPDGEIFKGAAADTGGFQMSINFLPNYIQEFLGEMLPNDLGGFYLPDDSGLTLSFNGAAHHESQASGGHNFYAALLLDDTVLPQFEKLLQAPPQAVEVVTVEAEAAAPQDTHKKTSEPAVKSEEDDAGVGEQSASKARILSRLKTAAVRMRERRGLKSESDGGAGTTGARSGLSYFKPATGQTAPSSTSTEGGASDRATIDGGIWVAVNCDKDPRKVKPNQTLQMSCRVVVASEIPNIGMRGYFQVQLSATLYVTDAKTDAAGKGYIRGRASVFGSLVMKNNQYQESESRTVNLNVEIEWGNSSGAGKGFKLSASDPESEGGAVFEGGWKGTPLDIGGVTSAMFGSEIFDLDLRSNPDVMNADDAHHADALRSLQILGRALRDPSFVDTSSSLLFPPSDAPTGELQVRGTRDWVLFHRRRTKSCETEQPPAPRAPNRRYQVYHARIEDTSLLQGYIELLRQSPEAFLKRLEFQPVMVVEFEANVAQLASDPQSIRSDWTAVQPGDQLLYAGVASKADVEGGSALATQRVQRLETAVDSVSSTNAQTITESLPFSPPPSFNTPGTDGSIFMLTNQTAGTSCQTVYRLVAGTENHKKFVDILEKDLVNGVVQHQQTLQEALQLVTPLGSVQFDLATSMVDESTLLAVVENWKKAGGGRVGPSTALYGMNEPTPMPLVLRDQTAVIHNALGGTNFLDGFQNFKAQMPQGCRVISIFLAGQEKEPKPTAETTCLTLYAVSDDDDTQKMFTSSLQKDDLGAAIKVCDPLGEVTFQKGTTTTVGTNAQQMKTKWASLMTLPVRGLVIMTRENATSDEKQAYQNQAAELGRALNQSVGQPNAPLPTPQFRTTKKSFPAGITCPAIVFYIGVLVKP